LGSLGASTKEVCRDGLRLSFGEPETEIAGSRLRRCYQRLGLPLIRGIFKGKRSKYLSYLKRIGNGDERETHFLKICKEKGNEHFIEKKTKRGWFATPPLVRAICLKTQKCSTQHKRVKFQQY
jgi:hypothetical protein